MSADLGVALSKNSIRGPSAGWSLSSRHTSIRILLADDYAIMRNALRALLERQATMQVVAEAGDGRTAVRLARSLLPDIVIMGINMPELNGAEATRQILRSSTGVRVIGLSMHEDKSLAQAMFAAGAWGYFLKSCALDELVEGIHAVYQGRKYLSRAISGVALTPGMRDDANVAGGVSLLLSHREREIAQLIAEGYRRKVIARLLHLSVHTVDIHRRNILNKLHVNNVAELTKLALREGLATLDLRPTFCTSLGAVYGE